MQPMWPTSLEKPLHKPPMHTKAPESAFALIIGGFLEKKTCFLWVRGTKTSCISIETIKLSPEKLACSMASISLVVLRTVCTILFALSCLCKIVSQRNKKCPVFNHQITRSKSICSLQHHTKHTYHTAKVSLRRLWRCAWKSMANQYE